MQYKFIYCTHRLNYRNNNFYSAGVGRTGTFIALDSLVHESFATKSVSIRHCVENLRNERVLMVQTPVCIH